MNEYICTKKIYQKHYIDASPIIPMFVSEYKV